MWSLSRSKNKGELNWKLCVPGPGVVRVVGIRLGRREERRGKLNEEKNRKH